MTKNAIVKKIIHALATAPNIALQRLHDEAADDDEKAYIRRIAGALNITIKEERR